MGTTLTGTTPQDTYDSLIKVTDNGPLSGTAKYLSDGLGNDSVLALSTAAVGIGTSAPSALLSVSNGGASGIELAPENDTNTNRLLNYNRGTGGYVDFRIDSASNQFLISGTEAMRITSAGNVGIGTSNPAGKLEIVDTTSRAGVTASLIIEGRQDGAANVLTLRSKDFSNPTDAIGPNHGPIMRFQGFDGTDFENMAYIQVAAQDQSVANADAPSFMAFGVSADGSSTPTERVRIQAGGGISFNGDTAAANALDDYEEGTWSATLAQLTSGTITLSDNTCTYTKIGRQVTVKGFLTISSVASPVGGSVAIGGLPFTIINSTSGRGTFSFVVLDASAGYNAFTGPTQHTANSTSIIAYYDASTLAASDEIMFTATYFV